MAGTGRGGSDDELDLDMDDPFAEPRRPRRTARPPPRTRRASVRAWDSSADDDRTEEWETEGPASSRSRWRKPPVYWRARDSLYFEPLVALAIVVLLLVGLYAYTENWPPAYVVESTSMQHGGNDEVGLINAGDMVLAEKVSASSIVPYVTGYGDGVRTYGEFGDVILYRANGNSSGTPIVHRAILFLQWDAAKTAYNATDLVGLPCGDQSNMTGGELYYTTNGDGKVGTGGCATTLLTGELQLYHVGWDSVTITIDLSWAALGGHSGFLTMGDGNPVPDQAEKNGGSLPSLSTLVEPGWIRGVARGMIPWFGAIKLLLQGNARNVSAGSWQFLGLSIIAMILAGFGVHYALRREGIESPLRRREEAEAAELEEEPEPSHGLFGSIRAWRSGDDEDEEAEEGRPPSPPRERRGGGERVARDTPTDARGRPRPRVHRVHRKRRDDDL